MNMIMKALIDLNAHGIFAVLIFPEYLHSIGISALSPSDFAETALGVFS